MLSKSRFWIDGALHIRQFRQSDIDVATSYFFSLDLDVQKLVTGQKNLDKDGLWSFQVSAGLDASPDVGWQIMGLAASRACRFPEDEIYSLMSVSGCTLPVVRGEAPDDTWSCWWERAVANGSLELILLPPTYIPDTKGRQSFNCIRPPFDSRLQALATGPRTERAYGEGLEARPLEVASGTVKVYARDAGSCRFITRINPFTLRADLLAHLSKVLSHEDEVLCHIICRAFETHDLITRKQSHILTESVHEYMEELCQSTSLKCHSNPLQRESRDRLDCLEKKFFQQHRTALKRLASYVGSFGCLQLAVLETEFSTTAVPVTTGPERTKFLEKSFLALQLTDADGDVLLESSLMTVEEQETNQAPSMSLHKIGVTRNLSVAFFLKRIWPPWLG